MTFPTYVFAGYLTDGKPAISSFKELFLLLSANIRIFFEKTTKLSKNLCILSNFVLISKNSTGESTYLLYLNFALQIYELFSKVANNKYL